jgi:hypothetical protein
MVPSTGPQSTCRIEAADAEDSDVAVVLSVRVNESSTAADVSIPAFGSGTASNEIISVYAVHEWMPVRYMRRPCPHGDPFSPRPM